MFNKRLLAATTAVFLAVGLAGCSLGSLRLSKEAVKAGLIKASADYYGEVDDDIKELWNCVVDKAYDDLSDDAVELLASGDSKEMQKITGADEDILDEAYFACLDLTDDDSNDIDGTDVYDDGTDDTDDTDDHTAAPTEDPSVGAGSVTMSDVTYDVGQSSGEWVIVTFTWTNKTSTAQSFIDYAMVEVTQDGEELERDWDWSDYSDGFGYGFDEVQPGESIKIRRAYFAKGRSDVTIVVTTWDGYPPVVLGEGTFSLE